MLNSEQALTTGAMQLSAQPFGPPAPKPISVWAIVSGVVALGLAANIVYSSLQPAHPPAEPGSVRPTKPVEHPANVGTTPLVRGAVSHEPNAPGAAARPSTMSRSTTGRSAPCVTLDQDIQSLDAAARVLLGADQQDAIRASKAKDRSRQLALGC